MDEQRLQPSVCLCVCVQFIFAQFILLFIFCFTSDADLERHSRGVTVTIAALQQAFTCIQMLNQTSNNTTAGAGFLPCFCCYC